MTTVDPVRRRRSASVAWFAIAACVLIAVLGQLPLLAMATWVAALIAVLFTNRHVTNDEHLVRPRAHYVISGAVLGVALAGAVMGMLPAATDKSQLLAVFFGVTAILAYRVLVAGGARPVMWLVGVTSFTWLPSAVVLLVGCKCGRREANWPELATHALFLSVLVLIALLVAISLIAFERRTTDLPDATLR